VACKKRENYIYQFKKGKFRQDREKQGIGVKVTLMTAVGSGIAAWDIVHSSTRSLARFQCEKAQ
jgi:hypothetical protein